MKHIKDYLMIFLCALILSALFLCFAVLALFSETARWFVDDVMKKVDDSLSEGGGRSIRNHRAKQECTVEG